MKKLENTTKAIPAQRCLICGEVFSSEEESDITEHLEIHDFLQKIKVGDTLSLRFSSAVYAMGHYEGRQFSREDGKIRKIAKDERGYDYLLLEFPDEEVRRYDIWAIVRNKEPYINGKKWRLDE